MNSSHSQIISIDSRKMDAASHAVVMFPSADSNSTLDWVERSFLAASPTISSDAAKKLVNDPHYFVRARLAANVHCSETTLAELAKDNNRLVRVAVAANQKTSFRVVLQLSKDLDSSVRESAWANSKLMSREFGAGLAPCA